MPEQCPAKNCKGTLHRRGIGRSLACNVCGYHEPRRRGRPRKNPEKLVDDRDIYLAKKIAPDRKIEYALFDPKLVPEGSIGVAHQASLIGTVVGCSYKSVERNLPGLVAIPASQWRDEEKEWINEFKGMAPYDEPVSD